MLKYKIPQIVTLTLDLLNYMLKYKIPQIVTLTLTNQENPLTRKSADP